MPRKTLHHVIAGRCALSEAMVLAPGGFRLIPGASGVSGMADLGPRHRDRVLEQLARLERLAEVLIIDCAAGISANVLAFAAAAHTTVITTTPEPTAVTDAYAMIKTLLRGDERAHLQLVVNMVAADAEARAIHRRMNAVTESFLHRSIEFGGAIPADPAVPAAVRHRLPFAVFAPGEPATRAVRGIAGQLVPAGDEGRGPGDPGHGCRGFFSRVASLLAGRRSDS